MLCRDLYRLADGDPQAARRIRMLRENASAGICLLARARHTGRTPSFHQRLTIGLLLEADLDHVDADVETEHRPRIGEGRAPLPGAGLGGQSLDAGFLVV